MKRFAAGALILIILAFFFQNCGKAGFENQEFSSSSTGQDVDPKLKGLPFPFQISVNQIAHMTCTIASTNAGTQSPYFSWKVGAFDNVEGPTAGAGIRASGLQLTSQFQTEWKKVAAGLSPSIHALKFKEFLAEHPAVAGYALQLSLRSPSSPANTLMPLPSGSASPTVSLLQPISAPALGESFVDLPVGPLNTFPNAPDFASRFLEKSLIVPSVYGAYDQALRANYDSSYLALGFASTAGEQAGVALASSGADARYAYGKGFRVHFGQANPHLGTSSYPPADSLAIVEEQDLETGYNTPGVSWDCSYKFRIVRNADRYKTMYRRDNFVKPGGNCPTPAVVSDYCASPVDNSFGIHPSRFPNGQCPSNRPRVANAAHCEEQYMLTCPPEPYSEDPGNPRLLEREDGVYHSRYPQRPAILHALRRFLPANQWDINVSRGCIVPKMDDNGCYQSAPIVYDEYFFPGTATNPSLGQYEGCGVNGQYQCSAYLTLCVRR